MMPDKPNTKTAGLKDFSPAVKVLKLVIRNHEIASSFSVASRGRRTAASHPNPDATRTRIAATALHP